MAPLHRPHRSSSRPRGLRAVLLATAAAGALLATSAAPAAASPADDVAAARSAQEAVAAEVAAVTGELAQAEEQLQRMTVEAEAAADAALVARAQLAAAQAAADEAAARLVAARAAVVEAEQEVADVGREAYMSAGDVYGGAAVLLDAESPEDMLQRAATLEVLGDQRSDVLQEFEDVEVEVAEAEAAARVAVTEQDRARQVADDTSAAAEQHLAGAQAQFDELSARRADLDARLHAAQVELLRLQGVADAEAAYAARVAAAARPDTLAVAAGAVAPTTGRVTSCYGSRWGTMHSGVDIAAPIGTPVFAPAGGVVLQAGPASGFGLAVYVQHAGGAITVYGHVNRFFVAAGDVVTTGQQIAEVGNRGQSTGPHLHFEVHQGGLYANRVNPVPWLSALGISLGGAC
ncbi:M23 family metallopeptidase [Trujillonella endophytica]|uniref:Peptidase family M23 n=1 Tax=Trujillonella endophytica TaxID=673521 RepID=A0A1H8VSS5_9ACTN|nr:M23 family metallopeptidase [Trujillella endophytica]SEP18415.1 Peptidase family M23 [Trujillella endophytica]